MAKTWINVPTPVTISAISAASGSQSSSKLAPIAGIHSHIEMVTGSAPPWMKGTAAMAATTNAPPIAAVASQPLNGSLTYLPKK